LARMAFQEGVGGRDVTLATGSSAWERSLRKLPMQGGERKAMEVGGKGEMSASDRFRHVMGHFATGVAVVTGRDPEGSPLGFTANAVASVSLDPLLVLVAVDRSSTSLPMLLKQEAFALSFLSAGHEELARRFAAEVRENRFEGLPLRVEATGSPVLEGALAWLDCSLWKTVDAGDHVVLFGRVERCGVDRKGEAPLVFYGGGYGTVTE